jgi:hypothetical protein
MRSVVTTFLHTDKTRSPDEMTADTPPTCAHCDQQMWLTSVAKNISDNGIDGVYTYECKICGARQKITRHAQRADGLPVVPEV